MWYLILAIITFFIAIVVDIIAENKGKNWSCWIFSLGALTGVLLFNGLDERPTAIDVYQGKTTLEITYKDSIAVDSIVVFKDKK